MSYFQCGFGNLDSPPASHSPVFRAADAGLLSCLHTSYDNTLSLKAKLHRHHGVEQSRRSASPSMAMAAAAAARARCRSICDTASSAVSISCSFRPRQPSIIVLGVEQRRWWYREKPTGVAAMFDALSSSRAVPNGGEGTAWLREEGVLGRGAN